MAKRLAMLALGGLLLAGCSAVGGTETTDTSADPPATSSVPPQSTTLATATTTDSAGGPVEPWTPIQHWIEVADGGFVDIRTGQPFVPRGVNLLHKFSGGHIDGLFGLYEPDRIDEELDAIAGWGFNTVRVFLDMCRGCVADAGGVKDTYLDNLADFISRAADRDLSLLITSNDLPDSPTFNDSLPCCEPFGGYRNSLYLTPQGVEAGRRYFSEIVGGLIERGARLEAVLGWQLANEQFYLTDVAPFILDDGDVATANGEIYRMGDPESVRAMAEESLIFYVDQVAESIRELDPYAMVTIGFFEPNEPVVSRPDDNRLVYVRRVMEESTLDFFDLHAYPGGHFGIEDYAINYGLAEFERTPVLMGEFGAFRSNAESPESGAGAVARWQAASCESGFDGWLYWLWGTSDDEVWTGTQGDDAINRALSPATRPDPCDEGEYVSTNVAAGRPVVASQEESTEYGAARAVDDSDGTWWSAADGPPQSLVIDLEHPRQITEIEILIGPVSPPGPQRHRLSVRGEDSEYRTVWEFDDTADQGDRLTFIPDVPLEGVRFVRLEVLAVDGWVIIHEVRVRGS